MKISDKRSAYFRVTDPLSDFLQLYFAYIDDIPGGASGVMSHPFHASDGKAFSDGEVLKIDACRPFVIFTDYSAVPNGTISSMLGASYSTVSTAGDGGSGAGRLFPGLKCGDFVTFESHL